MKYQPCIPFTRGLGSRIRSGLTLFAKGERGALLMETVIALSVFVLVGGTVLGGVSTTFLSGAITENQSIADNIARNQLESIAAQPFQEFAVNYTVITTPNGYQVAITSEALSSGIAIIDDNTQIQKLTVTVSTDGGEVILRLDTIKTTNL